MRYRGRWIYNNRRYIYMSFYIFTRIYISLSNYLPSFRKSLVCCILLKFFPLANSHPRKRAPYKPGWCESLTSDTLIFVSPRHVLFSVTRTSWYELINSVSSSDRSRFNRSRLSPLGEGDLVNKARKVGSVCSLSLSLSLLRLYTSPSSSDEARPRLHSCSSLRLFFSPPSGSLRDPRAGTGGIFVLRGFFSGFLARRLLCPYVYTYIRISYSSKGILGGFGAKDLLDYPAR